MRNELIPKVLKEYRKRNHYSVKDVSIRLMEHDIDVAPKTIYGWESGQAQPTADTLLLLCEIYKIPDILNSFGYDQPDDPAASLTYHEREIIYAYRNRPEVAACGRHSARMRLSILFPVIQSDLYDM